LCIVRGAGDGTLEKEAETSQRGSQRDAKDSKKMPRMTKKVDKDFVGAPTKYHKQKKCLKGSKNKQSGAERRPRDAKERPNGCQ